MNRRLLIGSIVGGVVLVAVLVWAFVVSTQPLPGVEELQNDRTHVPDGTKIAYKFNPPTSGPHYPDWITKGFYDTPRPDGNVVHSQEHGYIIIWYDCELPIKQSSLIPVVYAAEVSSTSSAPVSSLPMTTGSEGSPSASLSSLPAAFTNGSCDNLKSQLKNVYQTLGPHKIVVMPRVGMDSPVILTAWGRAEKLSSVDTDKIKAFIDAYRDNGPEHTDEP